MVGTKAWCNGGRSDRALVGRCIRRERGFAGSFSEALDRQGADDLYIMTARWEGRKTCICARVGMPLCTDRRGARLDRAHGQSSEPVVYPMSRPEYEAYTASSHPPFPVP